MQGRTGKTRDRYRVVPRAATLLIQRANRFQEVSYSHLLVPSRIVEPKTPIEDMMFDTEVLPKQHTLSR